MKRFFSVIVFVFIATPFCLAGEVSGLVSSSEPQQMLDFNLAGYGSRGEKTWEVQGASMDMQGNDVKISDITARLYGEREDMVLTADRGRYDREKGIVYLKDNVRAVTESGAHLATDSLDWAQKEQRITTEDQVNVTKDNMTATAKGVSAQPNFKVATFEKEVMLTFEEQEKVQGKPDQGAGLESGRMVITCDGPMELNYDKHTAVFEKNVNVEGGSQQGTMVADRMTVHFSPAAKQIEKIEAEGHVRIIRGENTCYSDGAVFTAADKKLLLTGRPKLVIFSEEGMNASP